eukprot:6473163-Ditylum_brightwellii.AAC.1
MTPTNALRLFWNIWLPSCQYTLAVTLFTKDEWKSPSFEQSYRNLASTRIQPVSLSLAQRNMEAFNFTISASNKGTFHLNT